VPARAPKLSARARSVPTQGWWYAILWLASIGMTSAAQAQIGSLERLVMPGPVAGVHADVEATCAGCHAPFARGEQNTLCLECHEDVARDLAASAGFHGKQPTVARLECAACHTEHEGRDADILGLDEDSFDHSLSNFPLLGKHREAMCVDCHVEEHATYHDAETQCNACHRDDDGHRGHLGPACADCQAETAWRDTL
jgi:hypothetical protein